MDSLGRYRKLFQTYIVPITDDLLDRAVNRITFTNSVHEDVVERFETVKNLLPWSRNSNHIRVAFEFAVNTFELALRIRYRQLEGADYLKERLDEEPDRLKRIADWHCSRGHLEAPKQVIDGLINLRNETMHPDNYARIGSKEIEFIVAIAEEIDHLFEDPSQRKERARKRKHLSSRLEDVVGDNGAVLQLEDLTKVVWRVENLVFENRSIPSRHRILFYPVERLDGNDEVQLTPPVFADCTAWSTQNDGSLVFELLGGEEFELRRELPESEQQPWMEGANSAISAKTDLINLHYDPSEARRVLMGPTIVTRPHQQTFDPLNRVKSLSELKSI